MKHNNIKRKALSILLVIVLAFTLSVAIFALPACGATDCPEYCQEQCCLCNDCDENPCICDEIAAMHTERDRINTMISVLYQNTTSSSLQTAVAAVDTAISTWNNNPDTINLTDINTQLLEEQRGRIPTLQTQAMHTERNRINGLIEALENFETSNTLRDAVNAIDSARTSWDTNPYTINLTDIDEDELEKQRLRIYELQQTEGRLQAMQEERDRINLIIASLQGYNTVNALQAAIDSVRSAITAWNENPTTINLTDIDKDELERQEARIYTLTENLGIILKTGLVENPTYDVRISIFRRGAVIAQEYNDLFFEQPFIANSHDGQFSQAGVRGVIVGDEIHFEADYTHIMIDMLGIEPFMLYSPTGEFLFQIPSAGASGQPNWQSSFPAGTFAGNNHGISAWVAEPQEIASERNLAINPFSTLMVLENDGTANLQPSNSSEVASGKVFAFPHAYANHIVSGVTRPANLPRNAIDGITEGTNSWDGRGATRQLKIYFGRTVSLSSVRLYYEGAASNATLSFSNGETMDISVAAVAGFQEFGLSGDIETSFIRISGLNGLVREFEAIGTEEGEMRVATKTYQQNTFINPVVQTTDRFSAEDIREVLDFSGRDAWEIAHTRTNRNHTSGGILDSWSVPNQPRQRPNPGVPNSAATWGGSQGHLIEWSQPSRANTTWVDSVLYSALTDAFSTTGELDHLLALRHVADYNRFTIRNNEVHRGHQARPIGADMLVGVDSLPNAGTDWRGHITDFADDYLMGETYLFLDALRPADHKRFNAFVNAQANLVARPTWSNQGQFNQNHWNRGTGFSPNAAEQIARNIPDGILDWWWCDAIYMGLNFLTFMAKATGDFRYIEVGFDSYIWWRDMLACRDENVHAGHETSHHNSGALAAPHGGPWALWHRDTDFINMGVNGVNRRSQWANIERGEGPWAPTEHADSPKPTFWGRGNGWVFAGIAKQIQYLNENFYRYGNLDRFQEIFDTYVEDLQMMAITLRYHQRDDGSWNVSIIDPGWFPGRESTGTSAFVYGLAIGVSMGALCYDTYMPVVENAWNALMDMRNPSFIAPSMPGGSAFFTGGIPEGRLGYMQSVGYQANNYMSEEFVRMRSSTFGYGLFIHAAAALMRMTHDFELPWFRVPVDNQLGVLRVPEFQGVVGF